MNRRKTGRRMAALVMTALALISGGNGITKAAGNENSRSAYFPSVYVEQTGKASAWAEPGTDAGIVDLWFGIEEADWSKATDLRIKVASVCPVDVNEIRLLLGDYKEEEDNQTVWLTQLQDSSVKLTNAEGNVLVSTYYSGPYMQIPASFVGYVQTKLGTDTEKDYWFYNDGSSKSFTYCPNNIGGTPQRTFDYSAVKWMVILFEPLNYDNLALHFGDVEVCIDGQWKTVFNMSGASMLEGENWESNVGAMRAGAVTLAPYVYDCTCDHMSAELQGGILCEEHVDDNGDNCCDLCMEKLPCIEHMDLNEDGVCDLCGGDASITVSVPADEEEDSGLEVEEVSRSADSEHDDRMLFVMILVTGVIVVTAEILIVCAVVKKKGKKSGKKQEECTDE